MRLTYMYEALFKHHWIFFKKRLICFFTIYVYVFAFHSSVWTVCMLRHTFLNTTHVIAHWPLSSCQLTTLNLSLPLILDL